MKKTLCLLVTMVILFTACAQSPAAPAWQEQYDLGVRYLSEGNYQEAIIAFTAAIEIDPKRADAYRSLADAYIATGDTEAAGDVLRRGFDATGDAQLAAGFAELKDVSPSEATVETNEYGATEFSGRSNFIPFDEFTSASQKTLDSIFTALIDGRQAYLLEIATGDMEALRSLSSDHHRPGSSGFNFYTQWNGYKVWMGMDFHTEEEYGGVSVQLRPEHGTAYYAWAGSKGKSSEDYERYQELTAGQCVNWQWEGAFQREETKHVVRSDGSEYTGSDITEGVLEKSLYHGTVTNTQSNWYNRGISETTTRQFSSGKLVDGENMEDQADILFTYQGRFRGTLDDQSVLDELYW